MKDSTADQPFRPEAAAKITVQLKRIYWPNPKFYPPFTPP